MPPDDVPPLEGSRSKTDKSLEDERHETDKVIVQKRATIEKQSDQKTQSNRVAADSKLEIQRAETDASNEDQKTNVIDQGIIIERERSDEAQAIARSEEDKVRNKERYQKQLIAEALLESERRDTDSNLLQERESTDASHDLTKNALITRDQFLAVVSHDLKNPLTAISMGAAMIRTSLIRQRASADCFKFLEIIERNVANMDRMISDLLDVERMANNKLVLDLARNNIGQLLQECADLFSPVVAGKSFTIEVQAMAQPIFARIDHDKILQVLSNLIGNSLKFSPKGCKIKLAARLRNENSENVEISVSDNGPGIPNEKKAQIFERFSQLKTNDRRGLGLGLFISKWIVEAHKGQIWVNSEIGEGSTFRFTLPISPSKV